MNFNSQPGLSWPEWIADPQNKALYEWNQAEAMKKYRRDEEELVQQIILQEKIQQDIQNQLNQITERQEAILSPGIGTAVSGIGGSAAGSGGYGNQATLQKGIGTYAVGTYLTALNVPVGASWEAGDNGIERFTVN